MLPTAAATFRVRLRLSRFINDRTEMVV